MILTILMNIYIYWISVIDIHMHNISNIMHVYYVIMIVSLSNRAIMPD